VLEQELIQYIKNNVDCRGIPSIQNGQWWTLTSRWSQDQIRAALADYIVDSGVPFPLKTMELQDLEELFRKFCITSQLGEYKDFGTVHERVDYRYPYSANPLGVIDKSHVFNPVSNYFQQENRMRCGSNSADSPWSIWHSREKLGKMNWHFWRKGALGKSHIGDSTFRSAFRIGTYTATQFKPSVAKALYEKHNAINVLDTSCGWGDRLAGFYATPGTKLYVGCDPNPEVFQTYKQQCLEYERMLGVVANLVEGPDYFICRGTKTVEVWNLPSEDMDWTKYAGLFDFYFTSPPYFETERYSDSNSAGQSWVRYPDFQSWKHNFFFRVNRAVWSTLADGGYMMLNIIDPRTGSKRMPLCDDMVDDILTYGGSNYLGKIGMRMQARPHAIVGTPKNSIFVEPVWVFRKGTDRYSPALTSLQDLFKIG
jgi:hypothetical protein